MKKSITLIFAAGFLFAMVFSCSNSNDGFESGIKPPTVSAAPNVPIDPNDPNAPIDPIDPNIQGKKAFCFVEGRDEPCSKIEISTELCEAIGGKILGPDEKCAGNYGLIPNFTCGWNPGIVARGDTAVLSLTYLDPKDPNCTPKAFHIHRGDTVFLSLDSNYAISDTYYSSFDIFGYLHCIDSTEASIMEGISPFKPCTQLEMSPTPTPKTTGKLRLNVDNADSSYYYIGTVPTITTYVTISNAEDAECGEIEHTWTPQNKSTAAPGTIKVVATAVCAGVSRRLDSAMATVIPDPVLSDCVLDNTAVVMRDGTDTPIMLEKDTLKVIKPTISNNYGRCGENATYSFNGSSSRIENTLSLKDSANKSIVAKVEITCTKGANREIISKTCPAVFVAYYLEKKGGCLDFEGKDSNGKDKKEQFQFKRGKTVFEFACEGEKKLEHAGDSYYLSCKSNKYTVFVKGFGLTTEGSEGDPKENENEGTNFYFKNPNGNGGLPLATTKEGNLWRFPEPSLITTDVSGGIECGIW
jgi:hypothetical protein